MRAARWTTTLLVGLALVSCESEREERMRSLRPMAPQAARPPSDAAPREIPAISGIRFQPATPRAGRRVEAVVATTGPHTPQLEYAWRLRDRPLGRLESVRLDGARPGDRIEVVVTPLLDGRSGAPVRHAARVAALAPRISGIRLDPPRNVSTGAPVTARPILDGVDPERVALRYAWWVNGQKTFESDATLSTEGLRRGDRVFVEVVARVGADATPPFRSEELVLGNAPPLVAADPPVRDESGFFRTRLRAHDPDGDAPIRFELKAGPPGLDLDAQSGEISWRPMGGASERHTVEVHVHDSQGGLTRTRFELSIEAAPRSAAPAPG